MDYATRRPEAQAVNAATIMAAVEFVLEVSTRFGVPDEILTDRGSHFVKMMTTIFKALGVKYIRTTPYHPQTDGMVERFNFTMKVMLDRSKAAFKGQWDLALPFILGEYQSSPCRATGLTPAELMLGRNLRTTLASLKSQWMNDSPIL